MDPNACLALIFDHLKSGNHEEAFYFCIDLKNWINKGGFLPESHGMTAYNIDDLRGFLRVTMDNCKRRSVAHLS